jgi:hypothetical protein
MMLPPVYVTTPAISILCLERKKERTRERKRERERERERESERE